MNTTISLPISKHTLSHNLLTPLSGIMGNIWLFDQEINQQVNNPEQAAEFISHLKEIWNDMKISGEEMLKFAKCVIEQAKDQERLTEKNITITNNACTYKPAEEPFLTILVVENNPIIQPIDQQALNNFNYEIDIVSNGYQALDSLCETHSAILIDINIPGMNGIETALKIRQQNSTIKNIPIIAVIDNNEDMQNVSKSTFFNACIQKPLDIRELNELIKNLIK